MPHEAGDRVVPTNGLSGVPPTQEEVDAILEKIFHAKESQESLDSAYALTNLLVKGTGHRGLSSYGIFARIRKAAGDKKNGALRESAQILLGALLEVYPRSLPISEVVFLIQEPDLLAVALDALSDKGGVVRESAQYAIDALYVNLKPEALVASLLPALLKYLGKRTGKWQGTEGALVLLGKMAEKGKLGSGGTKEENVGKEVLRETFGRKLSAVIPIVEDCMHDLKSEVSKQGRKTMMSLTTLLDNDDVSPRIPLLVDSMQNPSAESLQKAIHALSQTTFVAEVTSPVLALLTPLLERSLNTPTTSQEVLRQTVVVVENLTKLVHDPIEARAFLPKLKPGVQRVKDQASLPEVRALANRAIKVIREAMGGRSTTLRQIGPVTTEDVLAVLDKEVKSHGGIADNNDEDLWKLTRAYLSEMARDDANMRYLDRMLVTVGPYLPTLVKEGQAEPISKAVHDYFVEEDHRKFGRPVKAPDEEVEIVNADFSLGYGGMLLLAQTNLRLLKGHRYGLCGKNGAGKSTLMRSIADGKLEGFPSQDELRTCFVEHNQGEDADISVLEYMIKDPRLSSQGRDQISEVLEEVGFTSGPNGRQQHKVGSLSGGWKMKLALGRAMLLRADVLLLDEPTNHLDEANVKWLEEYLKRHTEITSLIVSHDSGFLDEVCTDIYHYEKKKLVLYPGNLAAFVRKVPEAKSYYTLSTSQVQFHFPNPGLLAGVKSNTKAIIRMSNASYTYPGQSKPTVEGINCQLTLSSRVAIVGPNGAGKSTMVKLLTGETIPQTGRVEKHPNLRIGYIKQHALEHVEMHLEKTPNQYLQWRYANGDDREVLLKQTRQLTTEDREQMERMVDVGDGKPKRVEALLGRQKYKKSFQYEVKWVGLLPKHNTQVSRETLLDLGFAKLIQEFDDHEASREGLGFRILEPRVIAQHFADIGLDPDIANHTEIESLSGGQKVKVVIAGAMWNNPHLLVFDEPTNFLDRDALGGLAVAVRDYRGGVVMISHHAEFVGALCPEQWHVADGRLMHKGHLAVALNAFDDGMSSGAVSSAAPSSRASSLAPSANASASASAANSEAEVEPGELKFKANKKKKITKKQLKEREVRRRLRHIEWLNSPKGTPHPPNTDDEAD